MNKKGEIGETLTWFAAFAIILITIVLFLAFTLVISASRGEVLAKLFSSSEDGRISPTGESSTALNSLVVFLNSNNNEVKNRLLIKDSGADKFFVQKCDEFLKKNYPIDTSTGYYSASLSVQSHNYDKNTWNLVKGYTCSLSYSAPSSTPTPYGSTSSYHAYKTELDTSIPLLHSERLTLKVVK